MHPTLIDAASAWPGTLAGTARLLGERGRQLAGRPLGMLAAQYQCQLQRVLRAEPRLRDDLVRVAIGVERLGQQLVAPTDIDRRPPFQRAGQHAEALSIRQQCGRRPGKVGRQAQFAHRHLHPLGGWVAHCLSCCPLTGTGQAVGGLLHIRHRRFFDLRTDDRRGAVIADDELSEPSGSDAVLAEIAGRHCQAALDRRVRRQLAPTVDPCRPTDSTSPSSRLRRSMTPPLTRPAQVGHAHRQAVEAGDQSDSLTGSATASPSDSRLPRSTKPGSP